MAGEDIPFDAKAQLLHAIASGDEAAVERIRQQYPEQVGRIMQGPSPTRDIAKALADSDSLPDMGADEADFSEQILQDDPFRESFDPIFGVSRPSCGRATPEGQLISCLVLLGIFGTIVMLAILSFAL